MARAFNGTNQYLSVAYPSIMLTPAGVALPRAVVAPPLTIACWINANALAGSIVVNICQVNVTPDGFWLSIGADGHIEALTMQGFLSLYAQAETTASYTAGNWHHGCAVFESSTSRIAYLDGGNAGVDTTAVTPAGTPTGVVIGAATGTGGFGYTAGKIAEVGLWNVALTPAEVASLGRGISPLFIRRENLFAYWPLIGRVSPDLELMHGLSVNVVNSPTVADHCRIIYPSSGAITNHIVVAGVLTPPFLSNPFQVFAPMVNQSGAISVPFISNPFQIFPPSLSFGAFEHVVGRSSFTLGHVDEPANLLIAANNAGATLAAAIDAVTEAPFIITLGGDVSKFSSSGAITVDLREGGGASSSEIMYFDDRNGAELTITARAQDGTTAKAFLVGAKVQMREIARHHNLLAETIIDVESAIFDLDADKAEITHSHSIDSIAGLQSALDAKADDTDLAGRVAKTGDTMTGALVLAGAPTLALHAATKAYVDLITPAVYNAKTYGLLGNGSTDDTAAFQALINLAASNGGGRLYFPPGTYLIGGALQDTGGINAQITLPSIAVTSPPVTIEILGASAPPTQVYIGSPLPVAGYSVIKSTVTGGSGTASCIGGREVGGYPTNLWNNVHLIIRNMVFQAPPNPSITMINAFNLMGSHYEQCLFHCGSVDINTIVEPTHTNSFAIKLAPSNHATGSTINVANVYGFYNGILDGELAAIHANVIGCKRAFVIPWANHLSSHRILGVFNCQNGICVAGPGFTGQNGDNGTKYLRIEALAIEQNYSGAGWGPAWADSIYDIDDPSNLLKGDLKWMVIKAGVGNTHAFVKNGGTGLLTSEVGT